LNTPEAEIYE